MAEEWRRSALIAPHVVWRWLTTATRRSCDFWLRGSSDADPVGRRGAPCQGHAPTSVNSAKRHQVAGPERVRPCGRNRHSGRLLRPGDHGPRQSAPPDRGRRSAHLPGLLRERRPFLASTEPGPGLDWDSARRREPTGRTKQSTCLTAERVGLTPSLRALQDPHPDSQGLADRPQTAKTGGGPIPGAFRCIDSPSVRTRRVRASSADLTVR